MGDGSSRDRRTGGIQFWDAKNAQVQFMLQGHRSSGEFLFPSFLPTYLSFEPPSSSLYPLIYICFLLVVISVHLSPVAGKFFRDEKWKLGG
jgi:hypothetical protein